jgi:hypothetical protein
MTSRPFGDSATWNEVEKEIRDHPNWCSKDCELFLRDAYRIQRLIKKRDKKDVQNDYNSCHRTS